MLQDSSNFYICVECGTESKSIYRKYQNGITKLSICENCHSTVDEYTEFDVVLIILNLLLHKIQAFRHVIFNSKTQGQTKLLFLYLLADTYSKWSYMKCHVIDDNDDSGQYNIDLFDWRAFLEQQFYAFFAVTMLEYLVYGLVAGKLLLVALKSVGSPLNRPNTRTRHVINILIISNYGKLLKVAAAIWSGNDKILSLILIQTFIFTTTCQTFKAFLSRKNYFVPFIVTSISMLTSAICSWMLQEYLVH